MFGPMLAMMDELELVHKRAPRKGALGRGDDVAVHHLKIWPEHFAAVTDPDPKKRKTVELRQNDRDFQTGDSIILQEFDPKTRQYTGRDTVVLITHMLTGGPWLQEGFAALSIRWMEEWESGVTTWHGTIETGAWDFKKPCCTLVSNTNREVGP